MTNLNFQRHDLVILKKSAMKAVFNRSEDVLHRSGDKFFNLYSDDSLPLIATVRRYAENEDRNTHVPIGMSSPFRNKNGSRLRLASYVYANEVDKWISPYDLIVNFKSYSNGIMSKKESDFFLS